MLAQFTGSFFPTAYPFVSHHIVFFITIIFFFSVVIELLIFGYCFFLSHENYGQIQLLF